MLPNRQNQVRVRANFDGEVELLVGLGERIAAGQALVIIEGEGQLERLAARNGATVAEVLVRSGTEVKQGTLLLTLQEDLPSA
jgi:acetyl/propionyl-CoA carboxylase alpha subunit